MAPGRCKFQTATPERKTGDQWFALAAAYSMAGKARVHELAKELGVTSKEILAQLANQGERVKSASSTVEAQSHADCARPTQTNSQAPINVAPTRMGGHWVLSTAGNVLAPTEKRRHESSSLALRPPQSARPTARPTCRESQRCDQQGVSEIPGLIWGFAYNVARSYSCRSTTPRRRLRGVTKAAQQRAPGEPTPEAAHDGRSARR